MESWRAVWRKGIAPLLSTEGLAALETALAADDQRLIQGQTTEPPPLQYAADWPVEAACAVCFAGWQGDGLRTVTEVEEFFAGVCHSTDERIGESAGCRWFLNWWDETPRAEARTLLLAEVQRSLQERQTTIPA